jgi:hypothetical protein
MAEEEKAERGSKKDFFLKVARGARRFGKIRNAKWGMRGAVAGGESLVAGGRKSGKAETLKF